MSQDIVERLRRAYAGERDPSLLAPDFELHQSPSIIDTDGTFRGRNAFRDVQLELDEFEDMSWEPEQFIEAPGGVVVVLVRALARGRGSGIEIDNHIAHVWSFRGNTSVRMVVYEEQADALDAVGLTSAAATDAGPSARAPQSAPPGSNTSRSH